MNSTPSGRRRIVARRALLAATTILAAGIITPVAAQLTPPAPVHQSVDANGVDLFAGTLNVRGPAVSIGGGRGQGLSYYLINKGAGWADNITAALNQSGSSVTVRLGGSTDAFTNNGGGNFTSVQGNGATLTQSGTTYTYTSSNDTVVHFSSSQANAAPYYANLGRAVDITRPSGMKLVYNYQQTQICTASKQGGDGQICTQHSYIYRLSNVTNSYGYALYFAYQSDDTGEDDDNGAEGLNLGPWSTVAGVSATNTENYGAGQLTQSISPGNPSYTVTDALNRTTTYRMDSSGSRVAGITRPGASSENVTVGYDGNNRVSSVASAAGTWSYSYAADNGDVRTVTVTAPSNVATTYVFSIALQRMTSMTDGLGHTSSWAYDGNGRLVTTTAAEGNAVTYAYDGRGNVTNTSYSAKPGSAQASIATSAAYDGTCNNAVTCNQPNTTTDANGNVTSYSYDPTHGGVTTVTAPAGANGVQPQVRYGYSSYSDAFGGTIYRQTSSSTCRTQSSCSGTSDEVVTSTNYGSLSGNNFLPLSTTKQAGDGSVSATGSMTYDGFGNMTSATDPVGAVTQMNYDADRELTETISADPDGSGPLKPRAVRVNYNTDGTVASSEVGTDTGGNFQSLQQVVSSYDAYGRKVEDAATAGGTTYSVTDYGYDGMGRPLCAAVRLNAATFANHTGACTLAAQGSDGPDRITLYNYDALSRVSSVVSAYGTGVQATAASTTFTANGRTASATDANNNTTSYAYDGFDRLTTTTYPGGSYEQLTLDSNGQVTSRQLRDGQSIGYGYDRLGRLTSKIRPDHNVFWETDLTYAWDNLGELVTANDGNNRTLGFQYDALGRVTSQSDAWYATGNASFQYDAAGRRTRMTWWDGQYVNYGYDALGEMTSITENGGPVPISFSYDDLGRRATLGRANATGTSYGYDGASRLTSLSLNGGNAANSYSYGYNAAGQLTSRTTSNDAYQTNGAASANGSYAVNNLNQYTSAGGTALGYDGRGNLTSQGSASYGYTSENQLASSPNTQLGYDSLGRLFNITSDQGRNTTITGEGDRLLAEIDQSTGAVLRRYVYGPGQDEPLIWYEGSDLSNRHYLHADERGSVVEVTDNSGNVIAINSYDEFGNPGSGNQGRFQYTGQKWLPALGMYDYKARMYSPALGRFLQTDPIGYGDGMNWYNYTGGDAVNFTDPNGTEEGKPPVAPPPIICIASDICVQGLIDKNRLTNDSCSFDNGCTSYSGIDTSKDVVINGVRPDNGSASDGNAASIPLPQNDIVVTARRLTDAALANIRELTREVVCGALSYLPSGTSLSLGADAQVYGGPGGYLGYSAFVDGNGNTGFNISYGGGVGFGAVGGAGISLGNTPSPGRTDISQVRTEIGVGVVGASGSASRFGGLGGSGGISAGPRLGYALGSVSGVSQTTVGGNICK